MNTAPSLAQFIEKQALSNKWREIWSIIGLLEKLVNGFPLFGGSTFEQEEDRAHPAGPRLHGLYPTGLQSSVAASPLVSPRACLFKGPSHVVLGLCPLPLKGGVGSRTSLGDYTCPPTGWKEWWCGGELSLPRASCYGCWWGKEAQESSTPRSARVS